jgi:hypothetical protein
MADRFDLERANTLDPNDATVRITQIRRRPSVDIPFLTNTSEWYEHFIKNYHAPGYRRGQETLSPDELTLTSQILWISEEKWLAASDHDPVAVENEKRHMAYCEQHGITHTRIREVKKDGVWWCQAITQVDSKWIPMAVGDLIVPSKILLPNQTPASLVIENSLKNGEL